MLVAADLHGHTLRSDARATPEAFVEERRRRGLELIAITDHDVMGAVKRGAAAAKKAGLVFLPAVECTTYLGFGTAQAEQIHVLAYFPPSFAEGGK
jgi:predicted metal-dependent phosphoesterase TrpH